MNTSLPFSNWSLQKALDTVPDSFNRARIRIMYFILLLSVLKTFVVIGIGGYHQQWMQVTRAVIVLAVYSVLAKVLLSRPHQLKPLAHAMLLIGVGLIWSNLLLYSNKINLITVQIALMVMLCGFYVLSNRGGILYSILGVVPVMLFLLLNGRAGVQFIPEGQRFASPGFEIIVGMNFISMIVAHYMFYEAFYQNFKEKERLTNELRLSIAEAHKLATSRADFLSMMSHELRTPLNSVVGITELLLQDDPAERQKENLKILQFSSHDLLSLINNVLDFNKLDSDKLLLEAVPFRLDEFMQNICAVLKIKANDKHLRFVLDIDEQLQGVNIVSDPTRLSQILYNLAGNAIKFTEQGNVTISLRSVQRTEHEVHILFLVTDTGIGIHPDRHEKIFEIFSQAESHTTRTYGGTGLGLSIVRQVVHLFNSEIQLESTPDKGSSFYFTIPFTISHEVATPNDALATDNADLSHLKILIAEDNDINRLIMKKQLAKMNITPVMVENGAQAYDASMADDYHAIFMDLHMPVMNGHEATQKIRAHADPLKSRVYIIAFTASVTEQEQIVESGFDDYLYKPVNMNELRGKIEKIASLNVVHQPAKPIAPPLPLGTPDLMA